MTTAEAARFVDVRPKTVRTWIRNGELRAVKLSDRNGWRIAEASLLEFLAQRLGDERITQLAVSPA